MDTKKQLDSSRPETNRLVVPVQLRYHSPGQFKYGRYSLLLSSRAFPLGVPATIQNPQYVAYASCLFITLTRPPVIITLKQIMQDLALLDNQPVHWIGGIRGTLRHPSKRHDYPTIYHLPPRIWIPQQACPFPIHLDGVIRECIGTYTERKYHILTLPALQYNPIAFGLEFALGRPLCREINWRGTTTKPRRGKAIL